MIKRLWLEIRIFALELESDWLFDQIPASGRMSSPSYRAWSEHHERLVSLRVQRRESLS